MKTLKNYILTSILLAASAGTSASDYAYEPFSNTFPSEQAMQQIEKKTAKPQVKGWWDDGPPGSGSGGGGAVGSVPVALGEFSFFQLLVCIGIYFSFKKWSNRKR
ncbi:hypothetical protein [Viscerimonas tarda]